MALQRAFCESFLFLAHAYKVARTLSFQCLFGSDQSMSPGIAKLRRSAAYISRDDKNRRQKREQGREESGDPFTISHSVHDMHSSRLSLHTQPTSITLVIGPSRPRISLLFTTYAHRTCYIFVWDLWDGYDRMECYMLLSTKKPRFAPMLSSCQSTPSCK